LKVPKIDKKTEAAIRTALVWELIPINSVASLTTKVIPKTKAITALKNARTPAVNRRKNPTKIIGAIDCRKSSVTISAVGVGFIE
jgi:hypothetical protein